MRLECYILKSKKTLTTNIVEPYWKRKKLLQHNDNAPPVMCPVQSMKNITFLQYP